MGESRFGLFERRVIGRKGSPLLTRLTILRTPWFSIKLHKFHRSDPSCLHDHPWPFVSVILWNGYVEVTETPSGQMTQQWYGAGDVLWRGSEWRHRVSLVEKNGRPLKPLTLVITGPKVRLWGFWTRGFGWVPFFDFEGKDDC